MSDGGSGHGGPDIDLIVATVGRTGLLGALIASVRDQDVSARLIVVDQSGDDCIAGLLRSEAELLPIIHARVGGGVSRARTEGLRHATAALVAWPDDDCTYPPGLLSRVVSEFAADARLDVLVGRIVDTSGAPGVLTSATTPRVLDSRSVWWYPGAPTFFARLAAARAVGDWNPALGPGGGSRWDAGEDSEWLIRAVRSGLRTRFEPEVQVVHRDPFPRGSREAWKRARRYGRCTVAVALAQGYGWRFVAWLWLRAVGGAVVSRAVGRPERARIHAEALIGRTQGALWILRGRGRGV
jgi:glycosyltransferase involved in cell wall biosynthesis